MAEPTTRVRPGLLVRETRPADALEIDWVLADAFGVSEPAGPHQGAGRSAAGDGGEHDPLAPHTWVAVDVAADGTERVVGVTSYRLRGQWFGGRRVSCAALSNVAVSIGHRGGCVGRRLVRAALDDARERGAALTALIPSTHAFYERLDCGVAGWRSRLDLTTDQLSTGLPRRDPERRVRRARPEDAAAVAALVADRARDGGGLLDHEPLEPPVGRGPAEDPSGPGRWVVEHGGTVTGWAEVTRRPSRVPGNPYELIVHDLVGFAPADEVALWIDVVAGHPAGLLARAPFVPGGLLELHLPRQVGSVTHETWMLGVLDLERALTQRGYPAGLTAAFDLEVTSADGTTGAPRGVTIGDGSAVVGPATRARPPLRLASTTLAAVYSGHLDPLTGSRQGLIEATAADLAGLRAVFAGPAAAPARGF